MSSNRQLRILCVSNGGLVQRGGTLWTHRMNGSFLCELGELTGEVCFCHWLDDKDDPLLQTDMQKIPKLRPLGLIPLRGSPGKKLLSGMRALSALLREISRANFVYLYCPGTLSGLAAYCCRILRKPYGIYLRGQVGITSPTWQRTFKTARFILTTGDLLREIAKEHCADVENVTPMMSLQPHHIQTPKKTGATGVLNLLYVGRLEERKGVNDLLGAVAQLENCESPFKLTMIGHCNNADDLLRRFPPAVAERVRLPGVVADFESLIPYYQAADMFVFPSHDEGFPRVLYEAMAFGLPIVTTFVGSIPTVMKDRQNCLRAEVKNPLDLAAKMRELIENPSLRFQLAQSGHCCISDLMKSWRRSHAVQIAERLGRLFSA